MADRAYGFRIVWSDEDEAYVASCPEFPGVVAHGDTPDEAVAEAQTALDLAIEAYKAEGWPLPDPRGLVGHSGQFRLRVPKSLHAELVERANEEGVSLNTYVATLLAVALGRARAETRAAGELRSLLHEVRSELTEAVVPTAYGSADAIEVLGVPDPWPAPRAGRNFNVALSS